MNDTSIAYRFKLIDSTEALYALQPSWNRLLCHCCNASLFSRPEWLLSWWDSFAQPDDQLAVVWVERHGEPFALAPLVVRTRRYYGLKRRVLCFLGEGNADRSDILINTSDAEMYNLLFDFLRGKIHWHVASFREVPEQSFLLSWARDHDLSQIEKDSDCPYITFKPGLVTESYHGTLSKNFRRGLSRMANRLKKTGEYRFRHQTLREHNASMLGRMRDIEQQSAKANRITHLVFSPEQNFFFQQRLLARIGEIVQPLLTTLELDGKIIAYLYGFIVNGVYHAYNTAFLQEYVRLSPGILTIQETVNYCIDEGLQGFDLLRGNSYYKGKWSNVTRAQFHLTIMEDSLVNHLHSWLIFTIRPTLKKLLKVEKSLVDKERRNQLE